MGRVDTCRALGQGQAGPGGPGTHGGAAAVAVFIKDVWVSTRHEAGPGICVQIKEQSLFLLTGCGAAAGASL